MHSLSCRTKPNRRRAASRGHLQTVETGYDARQPGLHREQTWRCLTVADGCAPIEADILVSRWVDCRSSRRCEKAVSSSDRHVIGVAVKATRMKLTRGPYVVFDGTMPAGTLHITGPSQIVKAEFRAPCDFIHFHVLNDCLRRSRDATHLNPSKHLPDLNDLVIRDPVAEVLCRTLVERVCRRSALRSECRPNPRHAHREIGAAAISSREIGAAAIGGKCLAQVAPEARTGICWHTLQ